LLHTIILRILGIPFALMFQNALLMTSYVTKYSLFNPNCGEVVQLWSLGISPEKIWNMILRKYILLCCQYSYSLEYEELSCKERLAMGHEYYRKECNQSAL
jgi:hypothetical protein